jgi:hypothetical protein
MSAEASKGKESQGEKGLRRRKLKDRLEKI